MPKFLKKAFYILLVWVLLHCAYSIIDGLRTPTRKADLAVILGNKINADGSLSERLKSRLDCGILLYNKSQIRGMLVSIGLGKEGYYEGDKMKTYLIKKGIPDSEIWVDNVGNNTRLTVKNTLALQKQLHFKSIIVVSQYFHITRTKMLFRKQGFTALEGASPRYFEWHDLYSIPREFFAFYFQCL